MAYEKLCACGCARPINPRCTYATVGCQSRRPVFERFWKKVDMTDSRGCWLWTGAKTHNGYGQFQAATRQGVGAHRWYFCQLFGPIPEGLQLDHLCRNTQCVIQLT